jgi:hypothetical protein
MRRRRTPGAVLYRAGVRLTERGRRPLRDAAGADAVCHSLCGLAMALALGALCNPAPDGFALSEVEAGRAA